MTSMSSVATDGSVSGSKLVTQNMLLGLDKGWMMGRGTKIEKQNISNTRYTDYVLLFQQRLC